MHFATLKSQKKNVLQKQKGCATLTSSLPSFSAVSLPPCFTIAQRWPLQQNGRFFWQLMIGKAVVNARVWGRGQMEVRAAMQWVPRRTMTEAWRRKQDHYAREVGECKRERESGESARTNTHIVERGHMQNFSESTAAALCPVRGTKSK